MVPELTFTKSAGEPLSCEQVLPLLTDTIYAALLGLRSDERVQQLCGIAYVTGPISRVRARRGGDVAVDRSFPQLEID